jgi:hypothetical protein
LIGRLLARRRAGLLHFAFRVPDFVSGGCSSPLEFLCNHCTCTSPGRPHRRVEFLITYDLNFKILDDNLSEPKKHEDFGSEVIVPLPLREPATEPPSGFRSTA